MPSNFRSLTNTSQEENMVQEPNLDTFVVCRAKEDIGLVQIGEVGEVPLLPLPSLAIRTAFFPRISTNCS